MYRDLSARGITTAHFFLYFSSVLLLKAKFVSVVLLTLSTLRVRSVYRCLRKILGVFSDKAKTMS